MGSRDVGDWGWRLAGGVGMCQLPEEGRAGEWRGMLRVGCGLQSGRHGPICLGPVEGFDGAWDASRGLRWDRSGCGLSAGYAVAWMDAGGAALPFWGGRTCVVLFGPWS